MKLAPSSGLACLAVALGACRGAPRESVAAAGERDAAPPSPLTSASLAASASSLAPLAGAASASITAEPTVEAPIRARFEALGGASRFGRPLAAARPFGASVAQPFERGCIGPDGSGALEAFTRCEPPPDLGPTLARLGPAVAKRSPGSDLSIAATWLPTGDRWSHRGDLRRVSASCAKFVWAAAALHRASIAAVEPAAVLAFGQSDNVRGRMLIDLAGGADAVNDYTSGVLGVAPRDLGLCRYTADVTRAASRCDASAKLNSFFSPDGAVRFLEGVFRGDGLGPAKRDALLAWAKLMPVGGFSIGHRLPREVEATMHHKRGELPTGCCGQRPGESWTAELAIVHTARGPYAIAISLSGARTYALQLDTIEWASCVVYHALMEDEPDPLAAKPCLR